MACRDIVEMVSDYLDEALPAEEQAHVQAHLSTCDGCETVLAQVRQTVHLLGRLEEEHLTDLQRETLRGVFHDHVNG